MSSLTARGQYSMQFKRKQHYTLDLKNRNVCLLKFFDIDHSIYTQTLEAHVYIQKFYIHLFIPSANLRKIIAYYHGGHMWN